MRQSPFWKLGFPNTALAEHCQVSRGSSPFAIARVKERYRILFNVTRSHLHPAWIVVFAVALTMMTASGVRTAFGVYVKPMEVEFGWSRAALSEVAAMSLLLLGVVSPLAGRLADRLGGRRVMTLSIILLGAGAICSAFVSRLWHVYVTAGILMALGSSGAGLAAGSAVIARWFEARRGVAFGLASSAISLGQLGIIPLAAAITLAYGWRTSYFVLGVVVLVVLAAAARFIRNDPKECGIQPYGAAGPGPTSDEIKALPGAGRVSLTEAAQ